MTLPRIGTFDAWRAAARGLATNGVAPEAVSWRLEGAAMALFEGAPPPEPRGELRVSKEFVTLARTAIWHRDPERFARAYALLWRLREDPRALRDPSDGDVAALERMARNVRRCQHKMKAFVRFRDAGGETRRRFVAWFEPTHHTVEPTAPFFAKRFGDMDWVIATPDVTAAFEAGKLRLLPGQAAPDLPEDATEELWATYYCNIFNPARLKVQAMTSEMPRKYWKNMPETRAIPELIRGAQARAETMAEAAPTLPPVVASRVGRQLEAHRSRWEGPTEALPAAIHACTRCPLHGPATQAVPGEGPVEARLMIVGEQPGDQEDLAGRPFVGPAGQVLDRALAAAGIARDEVYLTNAVKHFRFTPRGKARIHNRPDAGHVEACRWWLDAERAQVKPALIVAMGATAAQALTGSGAGLMKRRGGIETAGDGTPVLVTIHPSYLLRLPDRAEAERLRAAFTADLARARERVAQAA
ncbi:UdgX family uracil-DNA binding protein [Roseovarius sp. SCSIO 43702]|uniref:UdgX family uracil-DNA binding protein n=1 Tax=Roseovarius sp. SCSIO 43702 TaxID=2823043 RepID=UPI001C730A41|nr:UdgX family uracil-DNA binding protein [Roseovarius sp. SCSIO 43702]QYX56506.1 UdgX family uracil-DNA binding protein [Roseovarius sp. SCSIO 43702]